MARGAISELGTENVSQNGYTYVKTEDGWKLKHHIIAEKKIKRPLEKNERAFFKDGDKTNFKPSNIEIKTTREPEDPFEKLKKRVIDLEKHIEKEIGAINASLIELSEREKDATFDS